MSCFCARNLQDILWFKRSNKFIVETTLFIQFTLIPLCENGLLLYSPPNLKQASNIFPKIRKKRGENRPEIKHIHKIKAADNAGNVSPAHTQPTLKPPFLLLRAKKLRSTFSSSAEGRREGATVRHPWRRDAAHASPHSLIMPDSIPQDGHSLPCIPSVIIPM